jgi:hypothetical protein
MLPDAALADGDAVLVEETAEPEELAVGGGELFLELADRGPADIAFAAEFLGKDVRDVVVIGVLSSKNYCTTAARSASCYGPRSYHRRHQRRQPQLRWTLSVHPPRADRSLPPPPRLTSARFRNPPDYPAHQPPASHRHHRH